MEVKKSANKLGTYLMINLSSVIMSCHFCLTTGGKVVDVWNSSCTHLIMDTILVTVKVKSYLSFAKMMFLFR